MPDINLLPEDLRQEEAKELAKKKAEEATAVYHLPESATSRDLMKEEKKKPAAVEKIEPWEIKSAVKEKALPVKPPAPKIKKSRGWFSWLFGRKKKTAVSVPAHAGFDQEGSEVKKPSPNNVISDIQSRLPAAGAVEKVTVPATPPVKSKMEFKPTFFGRAIDVNLLPQGATLLPIKRLILYFCLSTVLGLVVIGGIYLSLYLSNQEAAKQLKAIDSQLAGVVKQVAGQQVTEAEALKWSEQAAAIQALLDRHIYWSLFFPELEKVTLPNVYYQGIQAGSDGFVSLKASAPDYLTLARQWKVLENNLQTFPQFEITNWSKDVSGVVFDLSLKLAPSLYYSLSSKKGSN